MVVPLGLRSTTARKAYLNLRKVPTYKTVKVKKQKKRTFTEIVEKKLPRKTTVNGIATGGYNYASNANQADIDIIAETQPVDSQNANLLILMPAGREEDTVSFLLGPSAVRYATSTPFVRCSERQHHLHAVARAEADGAWIRDRWHGADPLAHHRARRHVGR